MVSPELLGTQWTLRFAEKGGKSREIPVRHDLDQFLLGYPEAAGLKIEPKETFSSARPFVGRRF
jgi:hypothetical protein